MISNKFSKVASNEKHPDWGKHIERRQELYARKNDIRSPYERDYTRLLHSLAYRRLKHKTQVFFNIDNDHICTRMEHVQHVESVSCTIAKFLGLNTDLTRAIAMGHDLGHAPFGHEGEIELTQIRKENNLDRFWHERNSLRIIDNIELLADTQGHYRNLDLTYAVRDGIISHCGEVDDNGIHPRTEAIDLTEFTSSGQYQAYTWEGCVVKIADKIAYLGRDIEDAIRMEFIDKKTLTKLRKISKKYGESTLNTTVIMHNFIVNICENSSPQNGIMLDEKHNNMLKEIKDFNYEYIYKNPRFDTYRKYVGLIIRSIYETLLNVYDGANTLKRLKTLSKSFPELSGDFSEYLKRYMLPTEDIYENIKIYHRLESKDIYVQAIIDYISGMTDRYAISIFNELIKY